MSKEVKMAKKAEITQKSEQKIIEVATALFAHKGFEGASTREICKLAGVNISLISYYFGGKEELYKRIVDEIVQKIINYAQQNILMGASPEMIDTLSKEEKVQIFFTAMEKMIDFFYSGNISTEQLMIIFREQMNPGVTLNSYGFKMFKKLLASILEKDEDDKEVIFRCLSIVGQMNSARLLTQFSLKSLNQKTFTKDDIQLIKNIAISQTKAIFKDLGVSNE